MPNRDLTPEQRRRLREAKATINNPELQSRLRHSREAFAREPTVIRAMSAITDAVGVMLRQWNDGIARLAQQIDLDRVRQIMRTVGEAILRLVPPNARALGAEHWAALQQLGAEEQLCLSWVPNESTVRSLLAAGDRAAREQILIDATQSILDSCQRALDEVDATLSEVQLEDDVWPPQLTEVGSLVGSCIRAASDGHWAAAQALATCANDSLLTQHIAGRKGHTFVKLKLRLVEEEQFAALLLGPLLASVESSMRQPASWTRESENAGYSRNATVHAASGRVFRQVNALKSIIIATSLLKASASPLLFFLNDLVPAKPNSETSS